MTHTNPAAINFIQFMRRTAIARCEMRGGFEPGLSLEVTSQGNLTCHATPEGDGADGVPVFRTRFELNGEPISLDDAERVAMGEGVAI